MPPTPFEGLSEHTAAIQRIASALCTSEAEAEDVGQELWLAAQRRGGSVPVAWGPWLAGTCRRILWSRRRSEVRRQVREQQVARDESVPSAEERAVRMEVEMRLLQLVRKLPEAQSEVVYLRFWEGLPPREIAKRLEVSVEAVKTRQKRALAELRRRLSDETPGGRDAWMRALAGLPLPTLPTLGSTAASLSSFGVLMTVKNIALVLVLSLVGAGLWFSQADSEKPVTQSDSPSVAELSSTESDSTPLRTARSDRLQRTSAAEPGSPTVQTTAASKEALVITGRIWNVPIGGDRSQATPAAGVDVRLGWFLSGMGNEVVPSGVTDASGTFRLEQDSADYHAQMRVFAAGDETYASASEEIEWEKGRLEPFHVEVFRMAFTDLEGQVVDLAGNPIEGARMVFLSREVRVQETESGELGRFVFPQLTQFGHVIGELPGWMTVDSTAPQKDERGAWKPVRVVMCEAGALRVRIETETGEPVPGIRIALDLSRGEPLGQNPGGRGIGFRALQSEVTDAHGMVRFPAVWAGLNLRLRPSFQGVNFAIERERGGLLLANSTDGIGQPIVVLPKSERPLTLRVQPVRSLKCRVKAPDGTPFAKAHVQLASTGPDPKKPGHVTVWATTDEQGLCEIELTSPLPLGQALLSARETQPRFQPWEPGASPLADSLLVNLDQLPKEELLLTLVPTLTIEGKLVDGEGHALSGHISVNPLDSELVGRSLTTGFAPFASTSKGGRFVIAGVPEGRYEVHARSSDLARVVVPDIRAGTRDLVIRMTEPAAVQLEVLFDTGGIPMKQFVTLVGWHIPTPHSQQHLPALPKVSIYSEPIGWPPEMQGLWYGGGRAGSEVPGNSYWLVPSNEPRQVLKLDPGAFWIGGQASTADGTLLAQMGTGLVQIEEGQYQITFKMTPCVALSGRVKGATSIPDLALTLALPNGELLPLNVERETMFSIIPLGAQGDFRLQCVPAGRYELRIGTRKVLELGGASLTRMIELVPGEPLELALDLR